MNCRLSTSALHLIVLIIVVTEVNLTSGQLNNQVYMSSNSGNGVNGCSTQTSSYMRDGKKFQTVTIQGCGMQDYFEFEVPQNSGGVSVSNINNHLIIGDPNTSEFLLYSDQPGSMFVMSGGDCIRKSYVTDNYGQVSSTTATVSAAECNDVKQKAIEELEKNRVYWENWNSNFQANMRNTFRPGFPFYNQDRDDDNEVDVDDTGNDYGYSTSNAYAPNYFGGLRSFGNVMGNFGKRLSDNLAKTMSNAFRGFPFTR